MIILCLFFLIVSADGENNFADTEWELIPLNAGKEPKHFGLNNDKIVYNVNKNDSKGKSEFAEDSEEAVFNSLKNKFQDLITYYQNTSTTKSNLPVKNERLIFPDEIISTNSGGYTYSGAYYQPIRIEIGLASELETYPNYRPKIYFEITNNQSQSTLLLFKCEDTQGLLFTMWPLKSWLGAGESTVVTVTLWTKGNTDSSFQDQVTLQAISINNRWEKTAIVYISNQKIPEYYQPTITYELITDCYKVLTGNCRDATWSTEVTIQDRDSGLLRISSIPSGIYFPTNYVAGTKASVKGYYTASCCQSTVKVTATDTKINMITKEISAYELKAWVIALIAISALILLALIIGFIVWIVRKKQKGSVDLPVYRGSSNPTSS